MKIKSIIYLFSSLLLTSSLGAKDFSGLDRYVESLMRSHNVPGVAVGVIQNSQIQMAKGYGYRDKEKALLVNADTQFSIGSLSKAFGALGALILADRGQMPLDEAVSRHFPNFELSTTDATKNATPIDLLSHQSGQGRHDLMWLGSPASMPTLVGRLPFLEANLNFRERYQYNNLMYMAMGAYTAQLSGSSWADFTEREILNFLGMSRSNTSTRDFTENYAHPYWHQSGDLVKRPIRVTDNMGPAAAVNSTVMDMLRWAEFGLKGVNARGERLIDQEHFDLWREPQVSTFEGESPVTTAVSYALGWRVQRYKGELVWRHGGSIGSYLSHLLLLPEHDAAVVVMQNADHKALTGLISYRIVDEIIGSQMSNLENEDFVYQFEDQKFPRLNKIPKKVDLQALNFTGRYSNRGYGPMEVKLVRGVKRVFYNDWNTPLWDSGSGRLSSTGEYFGQGSYTVGEGQKVQTIRLELESTVAPIEFERID